MILKLSGPLLYSCAEACTGDGGRTRLVGILLTVPPSKRNAEMKLLLGCAPQQMHDIARWYTEVAGLPCLLVVWE